MPSGAALALRGGGGPFGGVSDPLRTAAAVLLRRVSNRGGRVASRACWGAAIGVSGVATIAICGFPNGARGWTRLVKGHFSPKWFWW